MTTTIDTPRSAAPWHLWVVGGLSLLWNAYGGYDYWMSKTAGDTYFKSMGMTDAQIAYFHAYPLWMNADWAIGVWSSVLGSILLLARSRFAFHAFALSFIAIVVSVIYGQLGAGAEANTSMTLIMQAVVALVCGLLVWYSRTMTKRGVLR